MLSVISPGNNVAGPANFTVPDTDIPNEFKDGSQGSPLGANLGVLSAVLSPKASASGQQVLLTVEAASEEQKVPITSGKDDLKKNLYK